MINELTNGRIALERNELLNFRAAAGSTIACDGGLVWVTLEGERDDHWLPPGASLQSHLSRQRHRALQHVLGQPQCAATRALGDRRQRHLLIVVVEHFEAVVAGVADLIKLRDECSDLLAVRAFAGKHAERARRRDALLDRADLLPHEVRKLDEEDLLR